MPWLFCCTGFDGYVKQSSKERMPDRGRGGRFPATPKTNISGSGQLLRQEVLSH